MADLLIQIAGAAQLAATSPWLDAVALGDIAEAWWIALRWATIYAAIAIFISSSDDLLLDLYFWVSSAQARLVGLFRRRVTTEDLYAKPQKRIAVIVPAWDESSVIAEMLRNNLERIDYDAYDIFVGVYQNDPATRAEVDRVAQTDPRVFRADVRSDGPSSKADALNWLVLAVMAHEREVGERYDLVVMQDAEDVVHPASLRVYNWHCDHADMIQLPVLSMPRAWGALVAGHYMDEFAEWHTKDLVARARLSGIVPSAGVATGFTRRAIQVLSDENEGRVFNTDSLTEDYDIGQRLKLYGMEGAFVRQYVRPLGPDGKPGERELVVTREFFPDTVRRSARQKARWVLGISLLGWRDLGWFGSAANRYFLYRDRKTLWTAPTGMLAYAIIVQVLLYELVVLIAPQADILPALIDDESWVWAIIMVNFWFLLNRVIHRFGFTMYVHGLRAALLSPGRLVVANYIGFLAVWRAVRLYLVHRITGKPLTWDKTDHAYPSPDQIDAVIGKRYAPAGAGAARPIRFDATRLDPALLAFASNPRAAPIGRVGGGGLLYAGEADGPGEGARLAPADPGDLAVALALIENPRALADAREALSGLGYTERYARLRRAAADQTGERIDAAALAKALSAPAPAEG